MLLTGRKKPVSATPKEMEWAQMACHRCLVYLGDLGKNKMIQSCRVLRQHVRHFVWAGTASEKNWCCRLGPDILYMFERY